MSKIIKCQDCGEEFIFTDGEEAFYKEKGFPEPKRCKNCRQARKNLRKEDANYGK